MKTSRLSALLLAILVAATAVWWQFGWKPASVGREVQNEPMVLTVMDHVRRALFEPTAKFSDVRYFEATQAACGEAVWTANSERPAGRSYFVAYMGGFVRFARDMPAREFLELVARSCPDKSVLRNATAALARAKDAASAPKAAPGS